MTGDINVIKRSGKSEPLDINKLHVMVEAACDGLAGVSVSQVEMSSQIQFFDGITTEQIQQILVNSASNLIDLEHPNYQFVAARLMLFALRKQVYGKMHELVTVKEQVERCVEAGVYDPEILTYYSDEEFAELEAMIDHDRDYIFTFAGLRQVLDKYLVQDRTSGAMFETPQFMYLLIAATIFSQYPKETRMSYVANIMKQHQSTVSIFQRLLWQVLERPLGSTLAACLLMPMTVSILSLALIWLLVDTLRKELASGSTLAESVDSTVRSVVERSAIPG